MNLDEKYPNQATMAGGKKRTFNQDNFFATMDIELVRKKFLQYSVFMEAVNNTLGLGYHTTMDEFMLRVQDLRIAAHREDHEDVTIPTKEELESEDPKI